MLRHPGRGLAHGLGQLVDWQLSLQQRPQQSHPCGVGDHPEHLDRQVDMVMSGLLRALTPHVRISTQMVGESVIGPGAYGRASPARSGRLSGGGGSPGSEGWTDSIWCAAGGPSGSLGR